MPVPEDYFEAARGELRSRRVVGQHVKCTSQLEKHETLPRLSMPAKTCMQSQLLKHSTTVPRTPALITWQSWFAQVVPS